MQLRPTPFDMALGSLVDERFALIHSALQAGHRDPRDRDAFLLTAEAVELLQELRPEEGLGEAMDQMVGFVHHAFLFWREGAPALTLNETQLATITAASAPSGTAPTPAALYVQLPERQIWAAAVPGEAHEPLDGVSLHHAPDDSLRVLGIFGLRNDRHGFSVVETIGFAPAESARPDGTASFASTLSGGAAAGLYSLADSGELLELGWRCRAFAQRPDADVRHGRSAIAG